MRNLFLIFFSLASTSVCAQQFDVDSVRNSSSYLMVKEKIVSEFKGATPGHFGPFVKGVDEDVVTKSKVLALTFDACGGKHGNGYDVELIQFLEKNKIPATLF